MRIGAVTISDRGALYLPGCLESFVRHVPPGLVNVRHLVDDSAHLLGLAGAVRAAWDWAVGEDLDFLLHVEEDFVFTASVPLAEMVAILGMAPYLAQVVLKRQPWSDAEAQAGGIIEMEPSAYEEKSFGPGCEVLEHGKVGDCGFSLNPCVIPKRVLAMGWPDSNEAGFSQICIDAGLSFAFYGKRHDPPRVCHVGAVRGTGWRL